MSRKISWTGPVKTVTETSPKRQSLKRMSKKLQKATKEYSRLRIEFLARLENQWCPVAAAGMVREDDAEGEPVYRWKLKTTEVHHSKGRGKYLNDITTWIAVSAAGHRVIHAHPKLARAKGWLI